MAREKNNTSDKNQETNEPSDKNQDITIEEIEKKSKKISDDLEIPKSKVEEKLKNLLDYNVPLKQAEKTVRRSLSSKNLENDTKQTKIEDLSSLKDKLVEIEGKVVRAGKRKIGSQEIIEGVLADETSRIGFIDWEKRINENDEIKITRGRVQERNEKIELSLGESTNISSTNIEKDIEKKDLSIKELEIGDRAIEIKAKVIELNEKEIEFNNTRKMISSGILSDHSGRIHFTDWDNNLKEEKSYKIKNAYINEFKGLPELNIDSYTKIEQTDEVETTQPPKITISKAIENDGAFDVWVKGRILEVREAGTITRCTECGRILKNGSCKRHGKVKGEKDIRTKAVLDDFTGALIVILDDEITENILNKTKNEIINQEENIKKDISKKLVGKKWSIRGDIGIGEYGSNLNAREIKKPEENPLDKAREIIEKYKT